MRKYAFTLMALTAMFGLSSCNKGLNPVKNIDENNGTSVIRARIETDDTKTALSYNSETSIYDVVWSSGDTFIINEETFTLSDGAGTKSGEFTGKLPTSDGTYDAWYGIDGAFLPVVQTYTAGAVNNSPMHASVTVSGDKAGAISFKNLCGLLKLSLKGTATIKAITVSANQAIAGAFTIDGNAAKMSAAGTCKYTTLKCGSGVTLDEATATDFYIAMPAGEYSGLKIELADNKSKTLTKTLKSGTLLIERSMITTASFELGEFTDPVAINGHSCVKIAGCYWATENVGEVIGATPKYCGAENNDYGCYYYMQNDAIAAAENWGGTWGLPTAEQWQALLNGCNCSWETGYLFGGKTTNGYLFTDKTDDTKSIFLPAAGYFWSTANYVEHLGAWGQYWSSRVNTSKPVQQRGTLLSFEGGAPFVKYDQNELTGFTVRPVAVIE